MAKLRRNGQLRCNGHELDREEGGDWVTGDGKPRMRLTWAHNKMHKENKFSSSMPMQMAAARRLQSIYSGKLK